MGIFEPRKSPSSTALHKIQIENGKFDPVFDGGKFSFDYQCPFCERAGLDIVARGVEGKTYLQTGPVFRRARRRVV